MCFIRPSHQCILLIGYTRIGGDNLSYSIGEFAKIIGVTTSMLRYYEKEGLLTPERDENNVREYTENDIGWVRFLLHLKSSGMSITELKQYTKWRAIGEETILDRKKLLEKRKNLLAQQIQQMQESMNILNQKIEFYQDQLDGNKYEFVLYHNEKSN